MQRSLTAKKREIDIEEHDLGCSLAPACLSCPFSVCRHDVRRMSALLVREEILRLHSQGLSVKEIGVRVFRTPRHIFRVLSVWR